jgi:hypothetical protein
MVSIDGEIAVHGTGSEDAFNGGYYEVSGRWDRQRSLPLSGCLEYDKARGRTDGYRASLADVYSFKCRLHYTIEHGVPAYARAQWCAGVRAAPFGGRQECTVSNGSRKERAVDGRGRESTQNRG